MDQNNETSTAKKLKPTEWIKKYFNYPMLLLAIATLLNIKQILRNFISIFTTLFRNPLGMGNAVVNLFIVCTPVLLVLLLGMDRFGKLKGAKRLVAILCAVFAGAKLILSISTFRYLLPLLGTDFYTMYNPLVSSLNSILQILSYALLAVVLFKNSQNQAAFRLVCVLNICVVLFFGILSALLGIGSLFNALVSVIGVIAIWNVPAVMADSYSAEITAQRWKRLFAIVCVVLVIFVCSGIGTGTWSSSSGGSTNTCGSCGRSWSAGDSGGNFMNIASSGLCNNCENNYHNFKQFLD